MDQYFLNDKNESKITPNTKFSNHDYYRYDHFFRGYLAYYDGAEIFDDVKWYIENVSEKSPWIDEEEKDRQLYNKVLNDEEKILDRYHWWYISENAVKDQYFRDSTCQRIPTFFKEFDNIQIRTNRDKERETSRKKIKELVILKNKEKQMIKDQIASMDEKTRQLYNEKRRKVKKEGDFKFLSEVVLAPDVEEKIIKEKGGKPDSFNNVVRSFDKTIDESIIEGKKIYKTVYEVFRKRASWERYCGLSERKDLFSVQDHIIKEKWGAYNRPTSAKYHAGFPLEKNKSNKLSENLESTNPQNSMNELNCEINLEYTPIERPLEEEFKLETHNKGPNKELVYLEWIKEHNPILDKEPQIKDFRCDKTFPYYINHEDNNIENYKEWIKEHNSESEKDFPDYHSVVK